MNVLGLGMNGMVDRMVLRFRIPKMIAIVIKTAKLISRRYILLRLVAIDATLSALLKSGLRIKICCRDILEYLAGTIIQFRGQR